MKVKELINRLYDFNEEADVCVIANFAVCDFSLSYGGGENTTKDNCTFVGLYVDELNQPEI